MTPYEIVLRNIGVFNKIIANLSDDPLDGKALFDARVPIIADREFCGATISDLISSLFYWGATKEGADFWCGLSIKFNKMSDIDLKKLLYKGIKYNKDLK